MRDVEHDRVGRRGGEPVERRGAVGGELHVVALERSARSSEVRTAGSSSTTRILISGASGEVGVSARA